MDFDLGQLSDAVLHLPASERAELASRLLESLESGPGEEPGVVAAAWEAELERRDAELAANPALGIPAEEVFARLESDLAKPATPGEGRR